MAWINTADLESNNADHYAVPGRNILCKVNCDQRHNASMIGSEADLICSTNSGDINA